MEEKQVKTDKKPETKDVPLFARKAEGKLVVRTAVSAGKEQMYK